MIAAIVPAAGLSSRMRGDLPKPLLPWGRHTIIEQVVRTLRAAGLEEITVVTGYAREAVAASLAGYPVRCVFNPNYPHGEMLSSLQVGLSATSGSATGALLALADQPQIEAGVIRQVVSAFLASQEKRIVVPSYRMQRGHPICLPRPLWSEVLDLPAEETLRTVIRKHVASIEYVVVDTPSVLADLDTREDYDAAREAG